MVFYLMLLAKPFDDNPEKDECGGAYINCWVNTNDELEALRQAKEYLETERWEIVEVKDNHFVKREKYLDNPESLKYYTEAEELGICTVIYTWPADAEDTDVEPEDTKLKSMVDGYKPKAFFFNQDYDHGKRYVAWTSELKQLKGLVYDIIHEFPEELDILLKLRSENEPDKYLSYRGIVSKIGLTSTLQEHELYFFSDGTHQLCIKRNDTGEYIALDDHGILFIYSESETMAGICRNNLFENRKEKLINELSHWHYIPKDSEKLGGVIIQKLSLEAAE